MKLRFVLVVGSGEMECKRADDISSIETRQANKKEEERKNYVYLPHGFLLSPWIIKESLQLCTKIKSVALIFFYQNQETLSRKKENH